MSTQSPPNTQSSIMPVIIYYAALPYKRPHYALYKLSVDPSVCLSRAHR